MADTDMMAGGINKMTAMVAGAILLVIGLLGFVNDPVLGIFEVSLVHNFVHILTGAVLLAVAFINNGANARMTLLVLGVVYALVAILGFVARSVVEPILADGNVTNTTWMADNVLHVILAIVFIAVPLVAKEDVRRPMTGSPRV